MSTSRSITDAQINAYVDGELDEASRLEFEQLLLNNPEDAARVAAYKQQNDELQNLYGALIEEPVPAEMRKMVMQHKSRPSLAPWMQVAAAVTLLLVGGITGWGLRGTQPREIVAAAVPEYVERAVGAHFVYTSEVLHPVEVTAAREAHLVGWLSKRLGNPVKMPNLVSIGYNLVGGRLLEDQGSPAAQFMYEDASGRRVTVYVRSYDGNDTAFKFFTSKEVSAFYWIDAPFAYALSGELPRQELMNIAQVVYKEISP